MHLVMISNNEVDPLSEIVEATQLPDSEIIPERNVVSRSQSNSAIRLYISS